MPTLQDLNGYYSITIPKELVEAKGYKKGDKFSVHLNERGNIELYKVK